jgi:hypothetical protein
MIPPTMDVRTLSDEKLANILTFLVTFGYIDGTFDPAEQRFVTGYVNGLLAALAEASSEDPRRRAEVHARVGAALDGVYRRVAAEIEELGDEGPRAEDGGETFLYARLKVRCVELYRAFGPGEQRELLVLLESFMLADGRVAPEEKRMREQLVAVLAAPPPPAPAVAGTTSMRVVAAGALATTGEDHPFLQLLEHPFSPHPVELHSQLSREYALVGQVLALWEAQRARGQGRLRGVQRIAELPQGSTLLDGNVYVQRIDPIRPCEIIVIGDLHGCYSCLKGALLQTDFFRRVWLHQWDPVNHHDVKLVFLGDYIDRGRYGLDGVLRTVLNLLVAMPDHVFALRGNHEWFVPTPVGVRSGVYPAEALATLAACGAEEMLEAYRVLFEAMPTLFLTERTMIVHGGIPRDDTFQRYVDLASFNDPELRFQMMWSDPARAEHVPLELQLENARFSFGRGQFRTFMERTGFQTLIRGHEKIEDGFRVVYNLGDLMLINLFSAGGATNADLPLASSYRKVTPMALTLMCNADREDAYPWAIDWQTFNAPARNGYLRGLPELQFRSE